MTRKNKTLWSLILVLAAAVAADGSHIQEASLPPAACSEARACRQPRLFQEDRLRLPDPFRRLIEFDGRLGREEILRRDRRAGAPGPALPERPGERKGRSESRTGADGA